MIVANSQQVICLWVHNMHPGHAGIALLLPSRNIFFQKLYGVLLVKN